MKLRINWEKIGDVREAMNASIRGKADFHVVRETTTKLSDFIPLVKSHQLINTLRKTANRTGANT